MTAIDQIWRDFLDIVQQEEGSRVVETWLKAVVLEQWDARARIVYLKAPNHFVQEWVSNNYSLLLQEHLSRLFAVKSVTISFIENNQLKEKVKYLEDKIKQIIIEQIQKKTEFSSKGPTFS